MTFKTLMVAAVLCLGIFAQESFACFIIPKIISKFDDSEFIFIGKVTAYSDEIASKNGNFKGRGIIVEATDIVYTPVNAAKHFEVFPLELTPDCRRHGYSLGDLKTNYPIGTELRIIAKKPTYYPESENEIIRLEDRPADLTNISPNHDENGSRVTTSDSIFDYKTYDYERDGDTESRADLPSFEIRKDLLRLKNSATQKERDAVLNRFLSVETTFSRLHLKGVLDNYASSPAEADRLYEENLKIFDPEVYKQYMGMKNARLELLKRGYSEQDVKTAMDKAMSEGAGFTAEEIVKGALKYLPNKN